MKKVSITTARAFIVALFAFWCQTSFAQSYAYDFSSMTEGEFPVELYYAINPDETTVSLVQGPERYSCVSVVIPESVTYEGKTYTVTEIGANAFEYNIFLTTVRMPNTITVIDDRAFYYTSLRSITFSTNLKQIGDAAFNDTELEIVSLPEGLESIGNNAFEGPRESKRLIKKVYMPNSVTYLGVRAFEGQRYMVEIALSENISEIPERAFYSCESLTSIELSNNVRKIGDEAFGGSGIEEITFPSSVREIGEYAFRNTNVEHIVLHDNIVNVGNFAFYQCERLRSISFPKNMKQIPLRVCEWCTALVEVNLSEEVQVIETGAFMRCSRLTRVTLPETIKEIQSAAFEFTGIATITLPDGLTELGASAFGYCSNLTEIVIPKGVTLIDESTFSNCTALKKVVLPDGITVIRGGAFLGCSNLTTINFPEKLTTLYARVFKDCTKLTHITLPDDIAVIRDEAFAGCNLRDVVIPEDVVSIGENAFNCDNLRAAVLKSSTQNLTPNIFSEYYLEELYLPFDLPADYDVEFTAQSVYVPLGCKAGYVANIQKNNPDYTGENVKELDFDARSFAINAAEGYGTYYTDRPFVMPEGVEGGVVTPGDAEGVMRVDYRYAAGDVVPAGFGLVLKGEPGTYAYESKYFYEAPAAPTENLLSGTVRQTVLPEDESVAYYMLSYDREGADLGFYWGAEDGGPFTNGAHRAYLDLPRGEAALAKAFVLDGDHLATGIGGVTSPTAGVPAAVYTLSGTKVTTPVDQLPRGLYIINGKKVFVPGK